MADLRTALEEGDMQMVGELVELIRPVEFTITYDDHTGNGIPVDEL